MAEVDTMVESYSRDYEYFNTRKMFVTLFYLFIMASPGQGTDRQRHKQTRPNFSPDPG